MEIYRTFSPDTLWRILTGFLHDKKLFWVSTEYKTIMIFHPKDLKRKPWNVRYLYTWNPNGASCFGWNFGLGVLDLLAVFLNLNESIPEMEY